MKTTTLTRTLTVAAITLAAVSLSGCSIIQGLLGGEDDVFSLEVGSCYNDYGDETEIATVPIVDCSELHDNEIYARADIEGDEFPGDAAVQEQADGICYDEFETFVGLSYDESKTLYYSTFYPSPDSWDQGDREILCGITKYDDEGIEIIQVTGTLKGSKE